MKTALKLLCFVGALSLNLQRSLGDDSYLLPNGPPGSDATRMPALNEVEPRQIIRALPYPISAPGSYVLVQNLTGASGSNGIVVTANDVTIDMNGFSLIGISGSLAGIQVSGVRERLYVLNGRVRNWGREGIDAANANNSRFERLLINTNGYGASRNGMTVGNRCVVNDCVFLENKFSGLYGDDDCKVSRCSSRQNTSFGVFMGCNSSIQDCTAAANGAGGFRVLDSSIIVRCNSFGNGDDGFYVEDNTTLSLCTAATNTQFGFNLSRGVVASDCTATDNGTGFQLYGALVHDCTARENQGDGFYSYLNFSSVIRNCTSAKNGGDGIDVGTGTTVTGSLVCDHTGSGQAGIRAGAQCVIADNTARNNYHGIYEAGGAVIKGNIACGNTNGIKSSGSYTSLIIQNIATGNSGANIETTADRYGALLTPTGRIDATNSLVNIIF